MFAEFSESKMFGPSAFVFACDLVPHLAKWPGLQQGGDCTFDIRRMSCIRETVLSKPFEDQISYLAWFRWQSWFLPDCYSFGFKMMFCQRSRNPTKYFIYPVVAKVIWFYDSGCCHVVLHNFSSSTAAGDWRSHPQMSFKTWMWLGSDGSPWFTVGDGSTLFPWKSSWQCTSFCHLLSMAMTVPWRVGEPPEPGPEWGRTW